MLYAILASLTLAVMAILLWPPRRKMLLPAVCIAAGTTLAYALLGSPHVADALAEREHTIAAALGDIPALEAETQASPESVRAWSALGLAHLIAEQYQQSAEAYKHAVLLSQGDPHAILQYARALIFAAQGTVTAEASRALDMVLLQDPEQPEARYFKAIADLQSGRTQEAMAAMKSLYRDLPDDSPLKKMINRQIGRE